jgi:hypothetical protein
MKMMRFANQLDRVARLGRASNQMLLSIAISEGGEFGGGQPYGLAAA